jgi:hypothetical protein
MTELLPSNAATEILMVELDSIIRDPSWPIDPTLVASFRASISRGEPPLLDLSLNRLHLSDGTVGMEIIDGMHRLEALRQEGVAQYSAKVREYSPQDAFYARIATSIGKPNELFRQRAEKALCEGFVRDLAAHLEGVTLYQRGMTDDGAILAIPRRQPLPTDPLLALGTILWIHFAAKPYVTEDWELYVLEWLDDIAKRLGKSPEWLRDEILDISPLIGEEVSGKRSAERIRLLLSIPDDGILRLVLARLKSEPRLTTSDLRFALDVLGCGPDVGRHTWLKSRGLSEMRSILSHATLSQLARDYGELLSKAERNKLMPRPSPSQPARESSDDLQALPAPAPVQPTSLPESNPVSREAADHSQVFGIVSPNFGGTAPKPPVKNTPQSPATIAPPPIDAYPQAHEATIALIHAWESFDRQRGDWSRADVQRDLSQLRTHLEKYIQRGRTTNIN